MPTVTSMKLRNLKANDTIIVILGPCGVGKSSFINTSTGQDSRCVGHSLKPCTMQLGAVRYRDNNEDIVFVDTPGCDVPMAPNMNGLSFVTSRLERMKIVLAGIIYIHGLHSYSRSVAQDLRLCKELYHKGVVRHVTLITTMWAIVGEVQGKRREELLLRNSWGTTFWSKSGLIRFKDTVESAWDIIRTVVTAAHAQRERVVRRLLNSIDGLRLTQPGQIIFEEHLRLCHELSHIARGLRRETSRAEGGATFKELDHIEDLINKSMMQIQGVKVPVLRRLKHLLLLRIPMKMGLTQSTSRLRQAASSSGYTVHITNSPITMPDGASVTRSIAVSSSDRDNSADQSSEAETFYSLFTWSNYSEGSVSTPGRSDGHHFIASASSHEGSLRNSFDSSIVPVNINPLATTSVVPLSSSPYSIQAHLLRSTDEVTVTGESSSQVERLANQLSHCIRKLARIIAEARRINPAQVNINEGDNYFGPIYNSGGFVGGRNNFNNLNNAADGLVELQYAFDRIAAQRTTQSQL